MYQLWGGGPPFTVHNANTLVDSVGQKVQLLGVTGNVLDDFKHNPIFADTVCAIVSCTDEPSWALECLQKFVSTPNKIPLINCIQEQQIFKANKRAHFQNLKEKHPCIEFSEMIFFDNEVSNIESVKKLGVHCIYCPDGLLESVWLGALQSFADSCI